MNLANSPASSRSNNQHHNSYGIYNYLTNKGYNDAQITNIIELYLTHKQFSNIRQLKSKQLKKAKLQYIQNNFKDFVYFVKSNAPF